MMRQGDVVIVTFPYVSGSRSKNRPALVVQCDRNNGRLSNTIVAMITGNTRRAAIEPTQVLIDPATPDGLGSGLRAASAVKCENLFTIAQDDVLAKIGSLNSSSMRRVDAALRAALELP
jgi:mRNA-degrading endonuclease toxin of MazEF toxin-antitoxin module